MRAIIKCIINIHFNVTLNHGGFMLNSLNAGMFQERCVENPIQSRHIRNEKEDLKKGIDLLYSFKQELDSLHPHVCNIIENLLQRQKY